MMLDRRSLLLGAATCGVAQLFSGLAWAAIPERRLFLRNAHNSERADICYFSGGRLRSDGIAELNHFMRDWRTNEVAKIDTDLLDVLVQLHAVADADARAPFTLISGYRSPKTNDSLRRTTSGVASRSQHMLGKAVDVRLKSVSLDRLHQAALGLRAGGVGYYPDSGFLHVDTGRVRSWAGSPD